MQRRREQKAEHERRNRERQASMAKRTSAHSGRFQVPFDPTDPNRLSWDLCVIIPLLLYLMIMMPFSLCFEYEPKVGTDLFIWELIVDFCFCFDIILSFATGITVTDVRICFPTQTHSRTALPYYL